MDQSSAFSRPWRRVRVRVGCVTLIAAVAVGGTTGSACLPEFSSSAVSEAVAVGGTAGSAILPGPFAAAVSGATPFATHGYGYDEGDGFLGQEIVNGIATFCLQILASPPTGDSAFLGYQAWASMSPDDNARVNWAVSNYGQMPDNNWAAATHLFVWSVADPEVYNSHGMSGDSYYVARAPREQHDDILAKLAQIRADAPSVTAGQQGGGGTLYMDVDSMNNYSGTLTVTGLNPADASGTVTLTNGVFVDNGSSSIAGVRDGMVLPIRGNPGDGVVDYKISVNGSFFKDTGWAGEVGVYETAGGAQQYTAGPGRRSSVSFDLPAVDPMSRSTVFQPVVTSQMQQTLIGVGGPITDHATCELAADSRTPEWRRNRDGSGVEVVWDVAFYEKNDDENDLPEVPEGREPIGTGTASCAEVGEVMEVTIDAPAGLTGQVTAVWSMELARQDERTAKILQADWHDAFGLAAETSVAPRVTTKAVPSVFDGEEYGDTAVHTDVDLYPDTAVQTFTSYRILNGQDVCDASTVFTEESDPVLVDGRSEVVGPTFVASPAMGEGVNWMQRTYADDTLDTLLSEGECGEDGEATLRKVKPEPRTPLASTGFDGGMVGGIAAGIIAAGLALLGGLQLRRRRAKSAASTTE